MTKTLYLRVEQGVTYATQPSDYGVRLTYSGYSAIGGKYKAVYDARHVNGNDYNDFVELKIAEVTFTRPADLYENLILDTGAHFREATNKWWNIQVPDNFTISNDTGPKPVIDFGKFIGSALPLTRGASHFRSEQLIWDGAAFVSTLGRATADSLSDITAATIKDAFKALMSDKAASLGLGGTLESVMRAQTVASALSSFHDQAALVNEQIFQGIYNDTLTPAQASAIVDGLIREQATQFIKAVESTSGTPKLVSSLLQGAGYLFSYKQDSAGKLGGTDATVYSGDPYAFSANSGFLQSAASVFFIDGGSSSFLYGRDGNDVISGGAGNDFMVGLGGNDVLIGGEGTDTAAYLGNRSNYAITRSSSGITVVDQSNAEMTDQLVGVERIRFRDVSIAYDADGEAGQAYRLYQAAFNRKPDEAGLGFQINDLDQGTTLLAVSANFIASPEFQRTYGAMSNLQFVTQLYRNVLHREPDSSGLAYHTSNLDGGQLRAAVLMGFSESPENQAALIGNIQSGMVFIHQ